MHIKGEGRRGNIDRHVRFDVEDIVPLEIDQVKSFTYLGVWISEEGDGSAEVAARIIKGDRCAGALGALFRSRHISRGAKLRVYKSVLRPTVTYGCETWVMNRKDVESLEIWEQKILRRIFGGKKECEGWRRRTNEELSQLYKEATITQFVRAQRIRWLGHVERREEHRIVGKVLHLRPMLNRRKGRPRTRWIQAVERDLQEKGIRNWPEKAKDRRRWKSIIKLWA
ncbi:hypothetical protein MML48_1g17267 [Holotrichia oblita]|uniref:Uncharacterized protein n=1 Tax=Holotrichia oblita TaxID=644536 RepID=A0ACB9TWN5_HOLOL|nr:hypothetical protein MML48_1g17267 [Holotrichia oblita]